MDSDYYSMSQSQRSKPSSVRAGTIIKIQMKNFMCHDNLEVTLNPRINFVIGKNGSGKSAIQTAIAVGLGGKALATNRGSSLKVLIKNDKNTANIRILLANEGPMAYKPNHYGDIIQVERTFSQSTQGYKLKNSSGKVVTTEKKELDKIVAHFNIQVDNPVCILHQDIARSFLNSSDPKVLFKFFLKASRFDDISKMYSEINSRALTIKSNVDRKFEVVKEAFKDVIEMKKKLTTLTEAKQKQKIKDNLENELAWAKVNEIDKDIDVQQKLLEAEEKVMKDVELKLKEVDESNLKTRLRELEEELTEKDSQVKDAREQLRPAREEYSRFKDQYSHHMIEVNEAKLSVNRAKSKYNRVLIEVENMARNAPEKKLRQEKLKEEIADCEKNLESIKAAERCSALYKQQLQDTIDNLRTRVEAVSEQHNDLRRQRSKRLEQIRQLEKSSNNLTVYGNTIMRFVSEVDKAARQGQFKKKPIGPLGMHIKVREPSWAGAVESFLGKAFLCSFCVDNLQDKKTIAAIKNSVYNRQKEPPPQIIQSKFLTQVHNTDRNETGNARFKSLLAMLDIDNPVVANCLIDQQEIESVLLIPTNNEAYQTLDKAHKVPRNCKKAVTQTGDQFYPAPNYKSYSCPRIVTNATLLQAAQEDIVKELRNEVAKLSNDITGLEEQIQTFNTQMKENTKSIRGCDAELRKLKSDVLKLEQTRNDLNDAVESESVSNVAYFVQEADELKAQLERENNKFETLQRTTEELKAQASEAKQIYEGLQSTIAESDQSKAPIQGEIQRLKSTIQQASTKAEFMKNRLKEHEKKITVLRKEIAALNEQKSENTENASQICDPVETRRSTADIERELRSLILYLKRIEEENGGSLEELQRNCSERQDIFDTVNKNLESVRSLIKKTSSALKQRRIKEHRLQVHLSNSAKHNFNMFLSERNYEGKLNFSLEEGLLKIEVKPLTDESMVTGQRLDSASLSGGEKSFSTVCFVMSLWQEVELPFHFLDEFDVFMDGINRRTVMDLLLTHAQNVNQQFVFLTPLDTSSIRGSDLVTIHRLEPPRG